MPAQQPLAAIVPTVRAAATQLHVADPVGVMLAGAAVVDITPPIGSPMAGYSKRSGKPSLGVHDPLFAKAIALSDGEDIVFLISADMLIIPPGFLHDVTSRLATAIPDAAHSQHVLLCATHTHSGPGAYLPGLLGRFTAGGYRPEARERLIAGCVAAATAAYRARRPAKLAVAHVEVPELVENRIQAGGPVDSTLTVLELAEPDGAPIALLVNFAAHPTLLSSKNLRFSADFPGVVTKELEAQYPGAVALFTNGAAGDLRPPHLGGLHNFELAEAIGTALAHKASEGLRSASWQNHVDVAAAGGLFRLPPTRLALGPVKIPHWLARRWVPEEAQITVVALNQTVLVSAPADLASEIGLRIKAQLAARGVSGVIVGYSQDYAGYIMPARLMGTEEYEARMAWHGPVMETVYEAAVFNLVEEYLACRQDSPGLPIVVLRGDPYAMGYTHGQRYRAQVQTSVANLLGFIERNVPHLPFRRAIVRWRLSSYYAKMKPFIPEPYLEELRGLADGSGVPLAELERVHALPEIASVWCTNSVVYGRATTDGRLLHLRNLDWAIQSDLQHASAIFVRHPMDGHASVSVGYFGFIGMLSGISDRGLSAGQIGAKASDQTVQGFPMSFLIRRVLERADDLPEAVRLIETAPRTAGFHYVFGDAFRREAVALETTRTRCAAFWGGDEAAQNVAYALRIPDALVRADPALDPGVRDVQRCSQGDPKKPGLEPPAGKAYDIRYRRHSELIQEQYGCLDAQALMAIARAVAPPSNVQSIVFAYPEFWVATARGSAAAAQQPYRHYHLTALLAQDGPPANPRRTTAP